MQLFQGINIDFFLFHFILFMGIRYGDERGGGIFNLLHDLLYELINNINIHLLCLFIYLLLLLL